MSVTSTLRSTAVLTAAGLVGAGMFAATAPPGATSLVERAASVSAASAATPDPHLRAALQAAPEPIRTPFEVSNGATWTTVPQAQKFLRELDASTERVSVSTVGRTTQGRPLQLVQVGAPAPQPGATASKGSVLMYTCSVHGDEPSGREACLQLARDMATTTDPAWLRLLRSTTVLLINPNPDGWVANTRGNADGVDVNRDYMSLATPEGRAIAKVIRDWKPDVLNDLHEYGPSTYYRTDLLQLWPRNRNVDSTIHSLSKTMSEDYSAAQVTSLGYTSGVYGLYVKDGEPFRQVAGDGQARILRNYAGLEHVVGMLSETANAPLNAAEAADTSLLNRRRVTVNYASAVGSAQMMIENRETIARQTAAAAQRATEKGARQSGVVYFGGQDTIIPTSASEVEPAPMCGYQLTAEQVTSLAPTLRLHGISFSRNASGGFVSMAQEDEPLIPLLLDARSEYRIAEATPVKTC